MVRFFLFFQNIFMNSNSKKLDQTASFEPGEPEFSGNGFLQKVPERTPPLSPWRDQEIRGQIVNVFTPLRNEVEWTRE